jgi:uncharacterized protein
MRTLLALCGLLLMGCSRMDENTPEFLADVATWRADRLARLQADDGWLTLVGLYWLEPGSNRIGSDPDNAVPLPTSVAAQVGVVKLDGDRVTFVPAKGVPLKETVLRDDAQEDYDVLRLGTIRFYHIARGGRHGIRVKDTESPARVHFQGLDYFAPDVSWRVEAKLTPGPHKVVFETEVGVTEEGMSPGYLEFDRAGAHYKLDGVQEDDELFVVIRDATSGKSTYAASRFVYAKMPGADGMTTLDFNRAYNPPCVFTQYATCPLPPKMNRLKVAIEAGEKSYRGHL